MTRENRIFIEKPKETMAYKEHTRKEIENNREALEPIIAKGEITFAEFSKMKNAILADLPFVSKANKFIVSLLENGLIQPSANPKIHDTEKSAEKEAERLCRLHNQEFVVLKVTASFKPQQPKKEVFA